MSKPRYRFVFIIEGSRVLWFRRDGLTLVRRREQAQ